MWYSTAPLLLAACVAGHSAVIETEFDGITYPGRSGPVDALVQAKRIEWNAGSDFWAGYNAMGKVDSPDIVCQKDAQPPEIHAIARAGSKVKVQWTTVVRGHHGPVMTYMGRLESPDQRPQDVKFFKISEKVYNRKTGLWGNEELLLKNNTDEVQIPSDIAPGMYIFRTELLALMGNSPILRNGPYGGPQFFVHCFNVEVTGTGKVNPKGVKFSQAYKRDDPSLNFDVWGKVKEHKNYVAPGPPIYKGKYNPPTGPAPVVKETGYYPSDLQKKYVALRDKWTEMATAAIGFINLTDAGNSRKGDPSPAETAQLKAKLDSAVNQIPNFLIDLEEFMQEVEKQGKVTKRAVSKITSFLSDLEALMQKLEKRGTSPKQWVA